MPEALPQVCRRLLLHWKETMHVKNDICYECMAYCAVCAYIMCIRWYTEKLICFCCKIVGTGEALVNCWKWDVILQVSFIQITIIRVILLNFQCEFWPNGTPVTIWAFKTSFTFCYRCITVFTIIYDCCLNTNTNTDTVAEQYYLRCMFFSFFLYIECMTG